MTDVVLSIDSTTIPATHKRSSSDFTVVLQNPIRLDSLAYNLVLLKLNTFYSIYNIDQSKYGNATITIRNTTTDTDSIIILPDGIYSFEDWNDTYRALGLALLNPLPVAFSVNRNTGKFQIVVNAGYELRISKTVAVMFGLIDKATITENPWWSNTQSQTPYAPGTYTSTFTPEWNMGILSLALEVDMIQNSIANGRTRAVIANFSPRTSPFGSLEYEPINLVYLQINSRNIPQINFRITDQSGNIVALHDEVSILLAIRPFGMGS